MAEIENEKEVLDYQSQFTKDNILELKNGINKGINTYADENLPEGEKLDVFVILTALQQAAFELIVRTFPKDDDDAKAAIDKMKVVADKQLQLIDEARKEFDTRAVEELLATIHTTSIVSEFYANRRDDYLKTLAEQVVASTQEQADARPTLEVIETEPNE